MVIRIAEHCFEKSRSVGAGLHLWCTTIIQKQERHETGIYAHGNAREETENGKLQAERRAYRFRS